MGLSRLGNLKELNNILKMTGCVSFKSFGSPKIYVLILRNQFFKEQIVSNFLQKMVLSILFILCSNMAFANSASLTTCPSINDFKASHFEMTVPYHYDVHTHSMKVLALVAYPFDADQVFDLLINPVNVASGDTLIDNVNTIISKLYPETDLPFTFHINDEDGSLSVCAYSLPGDTSITALLVADDSDMDSDQGISSVKEHRARRLQFFLKQFGLK